MKKRLTIVAIAYDLTSFAALRSECEQIAAACDTGFAFLAHYGGDDLCHNTGCLPAFPEDTEWVYFCQSFYEALPNRVLQKMVSVLETHEQWPFLIAETGAEAILCDSVLPTPLPSLSHCVIRKSALVEFTFRNDFIGDFPWLNLLFFSQFSSFPTLRVDLLELKRPPTPMSVCWLRKYTLFLQVSMSRLAAGDSNRIKTMFALDASQRVLEWRDRGDASLLVCLCDVVKEWKKMGWLAYLSKESCRFSTRLLRKDKFRKKLTQASVFGTEIVNIVRLFLPKRAAPRCIAGLSDPQVIFHYHYSGYYSTSNLGDYIQTLATRSALRTLFPHASFVSHERDHLSSYSGGPALVVLQGWFANTFGFLPNKEKLLPVFLGAHFCKRVKFFLRIAQKAGYFKDEEVGCRDLATLKFCNTVGIPAYYSRCLTLTFPRRSHPPAAGKVFFVDVPPEYLAGFPDELIRDAVIVWQRKIFSPIKNEYGALLEHAEMMLQKYATEARLVVTTALHCASPCLAMGIPVLLFQANTEMGGRFGSLTGILKTYTLQDLQSGNVPLTGDMPDITELKNAILDNLRQSVYRKTDVTCNAAELLDARKRIASSAVTT